MRTRPKKSERDEPSAPEKQQDHHQKDRKVAGGGSPVEIARPVVGSVARSLRSRVGVEVEEKTAKKEEKGGRGGGLCFPGEGGVRGGAAHGFRMLGREEGVRFPVPGREEGGGAGKGGGGCAGNGGRAGGRCREGRKGRAWFPSVGKGGGSRAGKGGRGGGGLGFPGGEGGQRGGAGKGGRGGGVRFPVPGREEGVMPGREGGPGRGAGKGGRGGLGFSVPEREEGAGRGGRKGREGGSGIPVFPVGGAGERCRRFKASTS